MAHTIIRHQAGVYTRFAANAFDSQIGKLLPLTIAGMAAGTCTLISAEVVDSGRAVLLTIESEDLPDVLGTNTRGGPNAGR